MHLGSNSLWRYIKAAVSLSNASWATTTNKQTAQHNNCHTSEHTYIPRSKAFLFISNWYKFKEIALDDSFRLSSIGVPQTFLWLWLTAVTTEPAVTMRATLFIIFTLTVIIRNHIICTPSCTFPAAVYCPVLTGWQSPINGITG